MATPAQLAQALSHQGEIRNQPQNRFLGAVADVLKPVSEFLDRDKISDRIPFLGGLSAADLTGVKGTESLVRDMSYGTPPIRGATLNTVKVDPRLVDVAGLGGAMIPVAKNLTKAALREGARQIETGTGIIGRNTLDPRTRMFAGEGAKTADKQALKVAKDMQAAGVPDETIHAKTGWFFGSADGKPRFEIDDSGAKGQFTHLDAENEKRVAYQALEHPSAYKEYPKLSKLNQYGFKAGKETGSFDPSFTDGKFTGNGLLIAQAPNETGIKSAGLHELQHAIQQREGFARGGSPEQFSLVRPTVDKIDFSAISPIMEKYGIPGDDLNDDAFSMLNSLYTKAREKGAKNTELEEILKQQDKIMDLTDKALSPYEQYRRLSGEAEARLTQSRMNMTAAQRAASYPPSMFDVPVKDQIVRYGDGQAMSVPKTSAGLFDTTGLENQGRELIQGKAEELAQRMRDAGVNVDLQHSGSAAGPSSYLRVAGMPDIRLSGHSKGVFNSQGVINVATPDEFSAVVAQAAKNQSALNNQISKMSQSYEQGAIPIRLASADKKLAKGKSLTKSEQGAVDWRNSQAMSVPERNGVGGAMMQGLEGNPKLNVMPNKRFALVEGNSNLRVEHKPDGTFTISHSPAWGETGKPFTLNGDSVDNLISTAESRLQRSENAMTAAAKGKHSKTVGGMLEMKHGDNFEYAKSARSNSQYITHTPTGAKIRISDHKLPDVYESADFEVSNALGKKEQAQSISKFLDDYATDRAKDDASIGVGGAMIQRPKTEFEILHDTAQRNAALPVEQGGLGLPEGNTAMERAGAMGFDTPAYHGSGEELRVINNEKLKRNAYGKGLHSASDPELANIFANHSSEGQNVSPLLLRLGNQASKEDYKNAMNQVWDEGGHDATKIRQLLIDKGFDTVTYNHGDFHYPQGAGLVKSLPNQDLSYATLNPSQVRSRFAAFDPFRRHEADILAGVGVGGMLDPQAIAEALRQQDRK